MSFRQLVLLTLITTACGDNKAGPDATPGKGDAGAVTTERCVYEPMPTNANASGTVTPGALSAGAAETVILAPVGSALGGYSARAVFLADGTKVVDNRVSPISDGFFPSIGIETAPRVKALALTAGGETVIIMDMDAIFVYEGLVFDLEQRLGDAYHGKLLVASSHSHSAWSQYTGHDALKVGAGELRDIVYKAVLDALEQAARGALAAQRPAKIGFSFDGNFDPTDQISHDRRSQNNMLPGGNRKDDHLYMIRVDGVDGAPIAMAPVYGNHGTLNDEGNSLASIDSNGMVERLVQEQFDAPVIVMHLQSAGADTSPSGHGGTDCDNHPGAAGDPCFDWLEAEGHARAALPAMMAAWTAAGADMQDTIALEMISRSIELGPKPETFTIRNGAMKYAPFDLSRPADGIIHDDAGAVISPIDEFNAPVGAALCGDVTGDLPIGGIPGDDDLEWYGSCVRLDVAASVLASALDLKIDVDATHPVCSTTRSTISALRIGDHLIGTLPGEVSVLLADLARSNSPVDEAHTIIVGYAQGHVGYMLRPEDWVLGGYEPSVTFWGPLEAEYLEERLTELLPLAMMPTRVDGAAGGTTKVATVHTTDSLDIDDPAPNAGTVPATVPANTWMRTGTPAQAQPAAMIPRVSGIATFVWLGDDPLAATPAVTLEREVSGVFTTVTRRSGRAVTDGDLIVATTPIPLARVTGQPQTHVWTVEWQAVPWLGSGALDDLGARAQVPLGRYRFHVVGKGWTLDSQPFTVVPGGLSGTATRTGSTIAGVASLDAEKGYRLLDMTLPSNRPVPLRAQTLTAAFVASGVALASTSVTTDANGAYSVSGSTAPVADHLRLTDAYGNTVDVPVE